jgi:hypothetical protein
MAVLQKFMEQLIWYDAMSDSQADSSCILEASDSSPVVYRCLSNTVIASTANLARGTSMTSIVPESLKAL